eukprot:70923-Prymnesium_polylepis.2
MAASHHSALELARQPAWTCSGRAGRHQIRGRCCACAAPAGQAFARPPVAMGRPAALEPPIL